MIALTTAEECEKAAVWLTQGGFTVSFNGEAEEAGFPKGCYMHADDGVYFNTHVSGSADASSMSLCGVNDACVTRHDDCYHDFLTRYSYDVLLSVDQH